MDGEYNSISFDGRPGCTIFAASYGDRVLFGNNEDSLNRAIYLWFDPGKKTKEADHGVVCVGFDDLFPQGGLNEKGLCYDINALPQVPLKPHPKHPKQGLEPLSGIMTIMRGSSTVKEVINMIQKVYRRDSSANQVFFADATGDAVVVSVGTNGELAFTRKEEGNGHLVSTNFNRANTKNGTFPCWRYNTAVTMLKKIKHEEDLNVKFFRSILDATHQEDAIINTVYSNIFDLQHGHIYLYYFHQFYEVINFRLIEELNKGFHIIKISDLFSQRTINNALVEYQTYQNMMMKPSYAKVFANQLKNVVRMVMKKDLLAHSKELLQFNSISLEIFQAIMKGELEKSVELIRKIQTLGVEHDLSELAQIYTMAGIRSFFYLGSGLETLESDLKSSKVGNILLSLVLAHLGKESDVKGIFEKLAIERTDIDSVGAQINPWKTTVLLEAAILIKDRKVAELLLQRLANCGVYTTGCFYTTCIARHLGTAAALLNKPEKARTYYQMALAIGQKINHRPEIALTRLQTAELLLQYFPKYKSEAKQHLDFVIAEFRDMNMQPSLEKAINYKEKLE